jgi:hypothetical protein
MKNWILALAIILTGINANASKGGGGGSMVLVNGQWTLQDYFGKHVHEGQPFRLTGAPAESLKTIVRLVSTYSHLKQDTMHSHLFEKMIDNAEYRYVTKLPCRDSQAGAVQYGCTKDGVTYLIREQFEKLSNVDRVFALLHERLHVLFDAKNDHDWIRPYVYTARILYSYLERQQDGEELELFPSEIKLVVGLIQINDTISVELQRLFKEAPAYHDVSSLALVLKTGGIVQQFKGVANCADMSATEASNLIRNSFVGVGSSIAHEACGTSELRDSKLVFSDVRGTSIYRSKIVNSEISNNSLKDQRWRVGLGSVNDSEVINSSLVTFASNHPWEFQSIQIDSSKIIDSKIQSYIDSEDPSIKDLIRICNTKVSGVAYAENSPYLNCN